MDLAKVIEHTRLGADTTPAEVELLCQQALAHGFHGVCVLPLYVAQAARCLRGGPSRVVTVVGFPLAGSPSRIKVVETEQALTDGADEIDMVMAVGLALAGDWAGVERDMRAVRAAARGVVLKVILETAYLSREQIRNAARCAVDSGAEFVKTSTGFGPRGASVEDIELLRECLERRAQIKASGGIRTREQALRLIDAGAARIGTSSSIRIVEPAPG